MRIPGSPRNYKDQKIMMLERLHHICLDNFFDDVTVNGSTLECDVRSFDERYHLEAREQNGVLEIDLEDCKPLPVTPEVLAFLRRHNERCYPLRRTVTSLEDIQDALDDLESAADDLFGFSHDLVARREIDDDGGSGKGVAGCGGGDRPGVFADLGGYAQVWHTLAAE